jgi:polyferredoxin
MRALAETFGDPFRTQSPKGPKSSYFEWILVPMVLFAVLATISVIFGWGRTETGQTHISLAYDFWGKFILAGVIGITTYPLLGPRIWCRYLCPWAGLFGAIGKWGKAGIAANDMCMGCGMCNKHCNMGIDIRANALKGEITKTTSCIYCGACVAVCPRRVLRVI